MTGSIGSRGSRSSGSSSSQQQHAASNVWYEPVAMSRVAGVYRLSSARAGRSRRALLCSARTADVPSYKPVLVDECCLGYVPQGWRVIFGSLFVLCEIRTWDTARVVRQRQRTLRGAFVVRGNPLEERNFLIGKERYDRIEGTCVCIFTRFESPPVGGTFGRPCAGSGDADYRIRQGSSSLPTDASC